MYTPQNLQQVSQLPLGMFMQGLGQLEQFKENDQATLANVMAERERAAQTHGLNMRQGEATLEGTMLDNQKARMTNESTAATLPSDIQAKIIENTGKMDKHQFDMWTRKVERGVAEGDPRMKAIWDNMPAIRTKREEAAQDKELAEMEDATRRRGQDMTAASARYTADQATARAAAKGAAGPRVPRSPRELYSMYQFEANNPDRTPEQRQEMQMLADRELEKIVQEQILKAQAMGAGKPDVAGMTQGSIPTRPMPQASDILPNRQPQPAAQPEPTNKGPAKISTQEEYNKLPPGALYVHPDGTVRRKRV